MTPGSFTRSWRGLAVVLLVALLAIVTSLVAAQSSCKRGNVLRTHIAHPTRAASSRSASPVIGP